MSKTINEKRDEELRQIYGLNLEEARKLVADIAKPGTYISNVLIRLAWLQRETSTTAPEDKKENI